MPNIEDQIASCDALPIHAPGFIQAYGALFGINSFGKLNWLSQNIATAVRDEYPRPFEFNPALLFEGFQPDRDMTGIALEVQLSELGRNLFPCHKWVAIRSFESGPNIVFEMEPTTQPLGADPLTKKETESVQKDTSPALKLLGEFLQSATTVEGKFDQAYLAEVLQSLCSYIAATAGFDRVMAYRFAGDGSGQVVAEQKKPHLQPFLHLHYPASDVPSQVRRLYIETGGRCIFDATQQGFQVLCNSSNIREATLDLSKSQLRGVSAIHAQYLRNMGVKSSFSVPIHYGNTLWGLIACHNYQAEFSECAPTYKHRYFIESLAHLFAGLIEGAASNCRRDASETIKRVVTAQPIQAGQVGVKVDHSALPTLMKHFEADGLLFRQDNRFTCTGTALDSIASQLSGATARNERNDLNSPDSLYRRLHGLSKRLFEALGNGIATQEALTQLIPGSLWEVAKLSEFEEFAGILVVQLQVAAATTQFIFLRKRSQAELLWAGQKGNETIKIDAKFYLSPRRSFEIWKELRTGAALPWSRNQQTIAADLFVALSSPSASSQAPQHEPTQATQVLNTAWRQTLEFAAGTKPLTDVRKYFNELVLLLEPLANAQGTHIILSYSEDVPSHIALSRHHLDKVFFSLFSAYFEGRLGATLVQGSGTTIRLIVGFTRSDPSKVSLLDMEILTEFKELTEEENRSLQKESLLEMHKINRKLSLLGAELKFSTAEYGKVLLERTVIRIPEVFCYFKPHNALLLEFQKVSNWQREWNAIRPLSIIVLTEFSSTLAELCEHLKATKHTVLEAKNPFEVFTLARHNKVDAIMADAESLHSLAYPLALILRENLETAQIPLLFESDYSKTYQGAALLGRFGAQPLFSMNSLLFNVELKEIAERKYSKVEPWLPENSWHKPEDKTSKVRALECDI